jgi:hypothetical protein
MKIRTGFVSNSSSTSFFFYTKTNNPQELFDLITKYHQYFDLQYNENYGDKDDKPIQTITYKDVINSIKSIPKLKSNCCMSFNDYVKELTQQNEILIKDLKTMPDNDFSKKYYIEEYQYNMENLDRIKKAKLNQLNNIWTIGFGDNHGDVCGYGVGVIMDYEGRNIYINKNDFVVYAKLNR